MDSTIFWFVKNCPRSWLFFSSSWRTPETLRKIYEDLFFGERLKFRFFFFFENACAFCPWFLASKRVYPLKVGPWRWPSTPPLWSKSYQWSLCGFPICWCIYISFCCAFWSIIILINHHLLYSGSHTSRNFVHNKISTVRRDASPSKS